MKCNCSLCFSSPAALLTWSGSHNDMATGFSPKMSEARRKLYLPIFGEMALERKLAKRFMVILLEWHTAFWSNPLPLHFFFFESQSAYNGLYYFYSEEKYNRKL